MTHTKTPEQIADEALARYPLNRDISRADARGIARDAIEADRAQRTITDVQYDGIIEAIDRAKSDDRSLDSDEYAAIVLEALGLTYP